MSVYAYEHGGTITLRPGDAERVNSSPDNWPWNRIPETGAEFRIIVDSSVNGSGPGLVSEVEGEYLTISGSWRMEILLGRDHEALRESRRWTESAISDQRKAGRILDQMARDERRVLGTPFAPMTWRP